MNMKKSRKHQSGITNLDFRSKQDKQSLEIFQPWKINKSYGTMGQSNYHLSMREYKKFFGVSEQKSKLNHEFSETPDPKTYNSVLFYKQKHILPKTKSLILDNKRIRQLEETEKGKEVFIGDSLLFSDTIKFRKERKNQIQLKTKKIDMLRAISTDAIFERKKTKESSDMIKIGKDKDNEKEKEKELLTGTMTKLPLEKDKHRERIEEILSNIRKRYMSRGNWAKLFKDWDKSNLGEISVYDAHEMINRIGIPINYNEAKALLVSSNTRGTDSLNLEEFLSMAFSENPIQIENSYTIDYCDNKQLKDPQVINSFKQISKSTQCKTVKPIEVIYLENYLRTKVPIFVNLLKKEGCALECTKDVFMKVLKTFPLPEKYTSEEIVNAIRDKYPSKENSNNVNFQYFIDHCLNKKNPNYFFDLKDKHMEVLKDKINNAHVEYDLELKYFNETNKEKETLRRLYIDQIEQRRKEGKDNNNSNNNSNGNINPICFSSMQPSKEFLFKTFKDLDKHHDKISDCIKKISTLPSIYKLEGKTRLGGNPPFQNTHLNIQPEKGSGMYRSESERFKVKGNDLLDFIVKEKLEKRLEKEQKSKRIASISDIFEKKQHTADMLLGYKNQMSSYNKSVQLYNYEYLNKVQNQFLES